MLRITKWFGKPPAAMPASPSLGDTTTGQPAQALPASPGPGARGSRAPSSDPSPATRYRVALPPRQRPADPLAKSTQLLDGDPALPVEQPARRPLPLPLPWEETAQAPDAPRLARDPRLQAGRQAARGLSSDEQHRVTAALGRHGGQALRRLAARARRASPHTLADRRQRLIHGLPHALQGDRAEGLHALVQQDVSALAAAEMRNAPGGTDRQSLTRHAAALLLRGLDGGQFGSQVLPADWDVLRGLLARMAGGAAAGRASGRSAQ
jgi:hypothetical protein